MHNLIRGINERVLQRKGADGIWVRPSKPDEAYIDLLFNVLERDLKPRLPKCTPITFEQFISKYTGAKKKRYERALSDWLKSPILDKRDRKISAFIKKELLMIKESKPIEDMIARIVQARTPKFNLQFGVYVRPCEDRIYLAIDEMFRRVTNSGPKERTVMKGLNVLEMAHEIVQKWARIPDCVFIGLDASRFDQCCNKQLLSLLHRTIELCFPNRKDRNRIAKLCAMTLVNKCEGKTADGIVKYLVNGGLCSGEMTTALTGCVIMSLVIFTFLRYHLKLHDFAAIDMGDDGGIMVERRYLEQVQRELPLFFSKFGLVMTVEEPVYRIEHIEFCQSHPVFDGKVWRMVRNPHSTMTKDATSLEVINNKKELANYLASIGKGGLSMTGGIPMFQDFYKSMVGQSERIMCGRKTTERKLKGGMYYLSKRMNCIYQKDITEDARVSFYHAFDILPEMQRAMEQRYKGVTLDWCSSMCTRPGERSYFSCKE